MVGSSVIPSLYLLPNLGIQECVPNFVRQNAVGHSVLPAICFDYSRTEGGEVDDVAPDGRLLAEKEIQVALTHVISPTTWPRAE